MTKKLLVIACFFPPIGGAGVQRAAKFVKYLPEFGWTPVVLTVKNPSVPVYDESLLDDIPQSVPVYRARTREPGYGAKQRVSAVEQSGSNGGSLVAAGKRLILGIAKALLQPDPQILWLPGARSMARQVFAEHDIDAIVATAPPFSSLLLGAHLARAYDVPLILDYRDEWDISNAVWENKSLGPVSRWVQGRMQNFALRRASAVTATTKLSTEALASKLEDLGSSVVSRCIYNGYDRQDIESAARTQSEASDRYLLSYVGTLWNLTSIEPIVSALILLQERDPELVGKIELQLAGRRTAAQESLLSKLEDTGVTLIRHEYLAHDEAVALMIRSRGLCLMLSDLEMARRVVPAKIFEYLTTGNAIFVVAPRGEVWDLVAGYSRAFCVEPRDINRLADYLSEEVRRFVESPDTAGVEFNHAKFERRKLTGDLAELLDSLIGPA